MWLLEHAFITGKADSCNLWAPQWLNAAHGGWAVLAASAVLERRPQHAPICSGSEEKDINSTSSTSFLSCRSLPVTSFSGHPAEVSLSLFLPWASTRWATAALHFHSDLLNLKSPSLMCRGWHYQSQGPQRPSTQTRVDAGGSTVIL